MRLDLLVNVFRLFPLTFLVFSLERLSLSQIALSPHAVEVAIQLCDVLQLHW